MDDYKEPAVSFTGKQNVSKNEPQNFGSLST